MHIIGKYTLYKYLDYIYICICEIFVSKKFFFPKRKSFPWHYYTIALEKVLIYNVIFLYFSNFYTFIYTYIIRIKAEFIIKLISFHTYVMIGTSNKVIWSCLCRNLENYITREKEISAAWINISNLSHSTILLAK